MAKRRSIRPVSNSPAQDLFTKLHDQLKITAPPVRATKVVDKVSCGNHKAPAIRSGVYQLSMTQTLKGDGFSYDSTQKENANTVLPAPMRFMIGGPRFAIPPQLVHTVYPPQDSFGAYYDSLPHIVLDRDTLPWERLFNRDEAKKTTPWLALLLCTEEEAPTEAFKKPTEANYPLSLDEKYPEKVRFIKFKDQATLDKICPKVTELGLLTHINIHTGADANDIHSERSIIMANRLPQKGKKHIVHLVSLERGFQLEMVSLYRWEFVCQADAPKSFHQLETVGLGDLQLKVQHKAYDAQFKKGFIPMKHHILDGSQTVSWYHSPLVPQFKNGDMRVVKRDPKKQQHHHDFLQWDIKTEKLVVSYAAAWQLGRLLTLQNQEVAQQLFFYKRRVKLYEQQQAEQQEQAGIVSTLKPPTLPLSFVSS